jgi:hypothetical protein
VLVLIVIAVGAIVVAGLLAVDMVLGGWVLLLGVCALMIGIGVAGELQPDPPKEKG